MNIKEAIILAGGLGTRIQSVLPDIPKCLAPVAGKPFLDYVINHFRIQGIEKFIFATGYKSEMIEDYLNNHSQIQYLVSKEKEPLGTGGAIKLAAQQASTKNILVLNGDTLFRINVGKLNVLHNLHEAICTLSLKPMKKAFPFRGADNSLAPLKNVTNCQSASNYLNIAEMLLEILMKS